MNDVATTVDNESWDNMSNGNPLVIPEMAAFFSLTLFPPCFRLQFQLKFYWA